MFEKESYFSSFERNDNAISDYRELCRFCHNVASKKTDAKTYKLFKLLTNVELIYTTEHPKGICVTCESKLQLACEFKFSLLKVEQPSSTYSHQKYVEFLRGLKEDNLYDEILHEVRMDSRTKNDDGDQPSNSSTVPLLKSKSQHENISKDSYRFQPDVQLTHLKLRAGVAFDIIFSRDFLPFTRQTVHDVNQYQQYQNEYVQRSESIGDYMGMHEGRAEVRTEHGESDNLLIHFSPESTNSTRNNKFLQRYNFVKSKSTQIKCVLIGDAGVGKTNLILSYLTNFVDKHVPTASDIYNFDVKVNDEPVHVTLCDTAGQGSFHQLRQLSYTDCDVFVLCFSVVEPESFFAIKHKWAPKFHKTEVPLLLVGTQTDLRTDKQVIDNLWKRGLRPVPVIDVLDFASSIGAEFIETSSRNKLGVKNAFDKAIWDALQALQLKKSKKPQFWKKLICLC